MNQFWNWLALGQIDIPTLKKKAEINANTINNTLYIIAGTGTDQKGISRDTVLRYVQEYLDNPNERIVGQKRYVIALYLKFTQGQ